MKWLVNGAKRRIIVEKENVPDCWWQFEDVKLIPGEVICVVLLRDNLYCNLYQEWADTKKFVILTSNISQEM